MTHFEYPWFKGRCRFLPDNLNVMAYWVRGGHACHLRLYLLVPGCIGSTHEIRANKMDCMAMFPWHFPRLLTLTPHCSYSGDRTKEISVCSLKMAAKWSFSFPVPRNRHCALKQPSRDVIACCWLERSLRTSSYCSYVENSLLRGELIAAKVIDHILILTFSYWMYV
jgi:hypothetical protein